MATVEGTARGRCAAGSPGGGARLYRRRHPERTVLYRALAHHLERFLQVYEERFERTHGRLRRSVEAAAHRYLDCGIFTQGAARVHCEQCGHHFLVAFSCKQRCLCSSCHQKRELLWAEWAAEELLEDVPHPQVVLTIPKRLRIFFRVDPLLCPFCGAEPPQEPEPLAPAPPGQRDLCYEPVEG